MIGSISDVLTRISTIEQQVQSLQSGTLLSSTLGVNNSSAGSATGAASAGNFANQLAAASSADTTAVNSNTTAVNSNASTAGSAAFGPLQDSALGSTAAAGAYSAGSSTGVSLSSAASAQLTSSQQQFASTLSADTGLNPNVVSAWVLAEESGGAAQSRQDANNNDWLNIGYTDSATYGASDSVWSDPTSAATATAAWLKGQDSIPGYGTASSGIQSILSTVGQTPAAQIQAIQQSGWASGGYPSLGSLYTQVAGSTSSGGTTL